MPLDEEMMANIQKVLENTTSQTLFMEHIAAIFLFCQGPGILCCNSSSVCLSVCYIFKSHYFANLGPTG